MDCNITFFVYRLKNGIHFMNHSRKLTWLLDSIVDQDIILRVSSGLLQACLGHPSFSGGLKLVAVCNLTARFH